MDDDSENMHNELVGRERLASLPIARLMMERIDALADADGNIDPDDAIAPMLGAIVSLEELIRGALGG